MDVTPDRQSITKLLLGLDGRLGQHRHIVTIACIEALFERMVKPRMLHDEEITPEDVDSAELVLIALVKAEAGCMRKHIEVEEKFEDGQLPKFVGRKEFSNAIAQICCDYGCPELAGRSDVERHEELPSNDAASDKPQPPRGGLPLNHNLLRKVDALPISGRSANCLRRENIVYVGELVQMTEREMLRTRNFGRTCLNEIKAVLSSLGLSLGMTVQDRSSEHLENPASGSTIPSEQHRSE